MAPLVKAPSDAYSTNLRQLASLTLEGGEEDAVVSRTSDGEEEAELATAVQSIKGEARVWWWADRWRQVASGARPPKPLAWPLACLPDACSQTNLSSRERL